jgi:methyl-accepting chemotaxis protein
VTQTRKESLKETKDDLEDLITDSENNIKDYTDSIFDINKAFRQVKDQTLESLSAIDTKLSDI